jgi:hypothetical protein
LSVAGKIFRHKWCGQHLLLLTWSWPLLLTHTLWCCLLESLLIRCNRTKLHGLDLKRISCDVFRGAYDARICLERALC